MQVLYMIIQIIIIVKIINKASHSLAKVIAFQKSKYPTFYLLYKKWIILSTQI